MVRSESKKLIQSLLLTEDEKRTFTPAGPLSFLMKQHVGKIFMASGVDHRMYKDQELTVISYQLENMNGDVCRMTPMLDFRNLYLYDADKYSKDMTLMELARRDLDTAMEAIAVFRLEKIEWTGEFPLRWSIAAEAHGYKTTDELTPDDYNKISGLYHSMSTYRKARKEASDLFEIAKIFITPLNE